MAGPLELMMVIKAVDNATGVLDRVTKSSDKLGLSWSKVAKGIAVGGAAITGAIIGMGAAITRLAVDSLPLEGIQSAFRGIADNADDMLAKLNESSLGMVRNRDLMKSYNLAAMLVGKTFADELPNALGLLTKVAAGTGQSMDYMMDSLVRGVGRLSPLILDNLGISVSLEEATARASREFGKEAEALSKAEQQAGMMDVVLDKLLEKTAAMPDIVGTATVAWAALGKTWLDLKDDIGAAAGPLLNDVATTLRRVLSTYGPALKTLFTGFFEMLRALWGVAKDTVKEIAAAMGVDFDTMAQNGQAWGENVIIQFAQGMANAFVWVVNVLNRLGQLIASWLAPGSPPKILPKIDEWGADAINEYLKGMGKGIDYDQAAAALQGIERYFEKAMRPMNERLSAIAHERLDITEGMELARLQARGNAPGAFERDPNQIRLAQLRIDEIKAQTELRDIEAEREKAVTKARDILMGKEREVALTEELASKLKDASGAAVSLADTMSNVVMPSFEKLPTLGEKFAERMKTVFDPLKQALGNLVGTWAGVFGTGAATEGGEIPYALDQPSAGRNLLQVVGGGLAAIWDKLTGWFTEVKPAWVDKLHDFFVASPSEKLEILFNTVTTLLGRLGGLLFDWITKSLIPFLQEQGNYIYDAIMTPWESALARVQKIVQEIQTFWSSIMPSVQGPAWVPSVQPKANGADFMTTGPQLLLVGEAGPEHVQVTPQNNYNLSIHTNAPTEPIIADFAMMQGFAG